MPMLSHPRVPAALSLLLLAVLVGACAGATARPSSVGSPMPTGTSGPSPSPAAGAIDHPSAATDVVLRVGEEGGFMMMEAVMSRVPRFTLYGDGRVVVSSAAQAAKGQVGVNGLPVEVLRETRLTEDELQAVLRNALVEGKVGIAKEEFPVLVMDVPTTVIELHAGGVDKRIKAAGLSLEPQPGPDLPVLTALARLVDRLVAIPTDADYVATSSVAILAETEPAPGVTAAPWPWPDTRPAAFAKPPPEDPFGFTRHVLTPPEADAVGVVPGGSGGPFPLEGPDGKTYLVVVRPALPDEAAR